MEEGESVKNVQYVVWMYGIGSVGVREIEVYVGDGGVDLVAKNETWSERKGRLLE